MSQRFIMYERIGQYYLRDIIGELLTLQFARESDCNDWMGFVNGVGNDFSFTCEVGDTCTITEDNMKLPMLLFNSQEDYQKWVNFIVDRIW